MDYHAYLAALSKLLPASVVHQALAVFGAVTLAYQGVLNGGPAVAKLADKVAGAALRSPARPLVLYFAPNIVKFLDGLTAVQRSGSVRGTLSIRPPPVMCAIAFTSATA